MTMLPAPRKALGQNFLTDRGVVQRIADATELQPGDQVLEVGPGRGALTRLLAERGARVVCVELDRDLVPHLRKEFASAENVEIVEGDILKVDLESLLSQRGTGRWKVAANLPYNISSQVLLSFIDHRHLFSDLVLMLQKEVGDRLASQPDCKEYGILSVFSQLHFDIEKLFIVRPGSFHPVPKVDSIVLRFRALDRPRVHVADERFFRRVVKAAFGQRRKTLWNAVRSAHFTADHSLREAFSKAGIDPERRGETLTLAEFAQLAAEIGAIASSDCGA